jgi:hypothetical protein
MRALYANMKKGGVVPDLLPSGYSGTYDGLAERKKLLKTLSPEDKAEYKRRELVREKERGDKLLKYKADHGGENFKPMEHGILKTIFSDPMKKAQKVFDKNYQQRKEEYDAKHPLLAQIRENPGIIAGTIVKTIAPLVPYASTILPILSPQLAAAPGLGDVAKAIAGRGRKLKGGGQWKNRLRFELNAARDTLREAAITARRNETITRSYYREWNDAIDYYFDDATIQGNERLVLSNFTNGKSKKMLTSRKLEAGRAKQEIVRTQVAAYNERVAQWLAANPAPAPLPTNNPLRRARVQVVPRRQPAIPAEADPAADPDMPADMPADGAEDPTNVGLGLLRGSGFFDNIWKYSQTLWKYIQPVAQSIYENPGTYAKLASAATGYFRSNKLNPSSQKWLDENQNSEIVSLKAIRTPVSKYLEGVLTLITKGKYAEAKKGLNYDAMFHLALVMELRDENGNTTLNKLEKLAEPSFQATDDSVFANPKTESIDIPLNGKQIRAGEFIKKAQDKIGNAFYNYDAFSTNCQHFVMNLLDANGLGSAEIKDFVYQNVEELLRQQPEYTSDFAKFITNLGHIKDRIFQGYGRKHLMGCKANHSEKSAMMIGGKKFIRINVPAEALTGGAHIQNFWDGCSLDVSPDPFGGHRYDINRADGNWLMSGSDAFWSAATATTAGRQAHKSAHPQPPPPPPPPDAIGGSSTSPAEGETSASLEECLEKWGIDKKKYLQSLRRNARKHGYNPKMVELATDGTHKVQIQTPEGRIVRFGRLGYGDYILWKALEAQGKSPKGFADQKKGVFHASHTKIRGNWKKNDYSPNNLALRLLW